MLADSRASMYYMKLSVSLEVAVNNTPECCAILRAFAKTMLIQFVLL